MKKAYIKAVSYYLPQNVLKNEELVEKFPEWSIDKIANKIGVNSRHIADNSETAGDMAKQAALNLFEEYKISPSEIDFVVLCTQSPDYFLPTTACILQNSLNIPTSAGAFDFNLGCSGYIYGLAIAKGLIAGGIAKNILLLTSETYTKHIHPKDKGNRTIFGDAASASLISDTGFARIGELSLGTDGSGANNLIVKNGGLRNPLKNDDIELNDEEGNPNYLYMNGAEIFSFTQEKVPFLVNDVLQVNSVNKSAVDLFILHQANRYMLDFLRRKMKIEEDKFFYYMSEVGNTVSSTIPIALAEAKKENKLRGNVLLAGFGVGYSWGGVILEIVN